VTVERKDRLRAAAQRAIRAQTLAVELRDAGRFKHVADDLDCPDLLRLAALTEELGEIARCLHDNDRDNLQPELDQLAGIALAWSTVA
jgi:hypothetical protein